MGYVHGATLPVYGLAHYFVIFTFFPCPFPFSNFLYFFSLEEGTLILAVDLMPLNAFFPTLVSLVDLIVIFPSLGQDEKAFFPIVFTPAPMVAFVSFLHPLNALSPIVVTFFPIVTFLSFLLFWNAFAEMEVTL